MGTLYNNELILTFAKKLANPKVESTIIHDALHLLLQNFKFEQGAIYEANQLHQFILKENISNHEVASFKPTLSEEIQKNFQEQLYDGTSFYLFYGQSKEKLSHVLCDIPECKTIVLQPIKDENEQILGFLFLHNENEYLTFTEEQIATLHVVLSILVNYVSRRMYENRLSFAITSLQDIIDNTGIDIYVNDFLTHEILYVNKSMAAPYGGVEKFKKRKCWEVLFPDQNGPCEFCPQQYIVDEQGNPSKVYTWDYKRAFDGSWFRVFSAAFHWIDGRLAHVVSSADITDNKKYEAMIHHLANYDSLTNLPNRRMLIEECKNRINKATTTEKGYIAFFDIDGFKNINDTLGHDAGDEFLIQLADFFREIPLLKDAIYRNGGDEFVAIIGGENITKDHIRNLSGFIQQRFTKPWKLSKGDVYCTTSMGVACFPEDGTNADTLLQVSDRAMYHVKRKNGNNICFGYELDETK